MVYFIGGLMLGVFGILLMVISYNIGFSGFYFPRRMNIVDTLLFLIGPTCFLLGIYFGFGNLSTNLFKKKIDFSDPIYHLTESRLRLFWNLKGQKAPLRVRSKFQDPFMEDEDFFTFLDDMDQIIFYSLLPRLSDLERRQFLRKE